MLSVTREAMELAEQKQRVNIGEEGYRAIGKFGKQGKVSYQYASCSGQKIMLSVKQRRITCFQTQELIRTTECFCITVVRKSLLLKL